MGNTGKINNQGNHTKGTDPKRNAKKAKTARSDAIIREWYPKEVASLTAKRIGPKTTAETVRARAAAIGVQSGRKKIPWTPEEDAILKKLYPTVAAKDIVGQIPGRTLHAIKRQASALGLRAKNGRKSRHRAAEIQVPTTDPGFNTDAENIAFCGRWS